MSKLYLCGITSDEEKNIRELVESAGGIFDGLIYCVDRAGIANEDMHHFLLNNMGCGQILFRPWTNDHDLSMNVFLREGPMKDGDWFVMRDSMERFGPMFRESFPAMLESWKANGVRSVFNYGKGFAFEWNDSMVFQGTPHWGILNYRGQSVDLKDLHDDTPAGEFTWRLKDGEAGGRPADNKIDHEAKYCWTYGRSNHLLLGLEQNLEQYRHAEQIRQLLRHNAQQRGFELTIDGLKSFMETLKNESPDEFELWVNSARPWKNFYRYHFLEHKFEDIESTEDEWKYEN